MGASHEPEETVIASPEAVYVYAGRLEDGTKVVRDSDGVLSALTSLIRAPGFAVGGSVPREPR